MKLVLFEGIMGSGKSSTAKFANNVLHEQGIKTNLYLEGNLDHPADYDSVACMNKEKYNELLNQYPDEASVLSPYVHMKNEDIFIPYGKIGKQISLPLYLEIQKDDIYEGLSLFKHSELLISNWRNFDKTASLIDDIAIFECCFLQNPMCSFLAKHNASEEEVTRHIMKLAQSVLNLDPLLVYFSTQDVRHTVENVCKVRSQEWLDFVIHYHTEQGYGLANGLKGFDGLIQFLEMRQEIELEVCKNLPFETLIVDHTAPDWEKTLPFIKEEILKRAN